MRHLFRLERTLRNSFPFLPALLALFIAGVASAQTAAPSWAANIQPGTWVAIGQNKLSDVDPEEDSGVNPDYPNSSPWRGSTGQNAVIQSWNGGAFAPTFGSKGSLLLHGGGHKNYFGSEVYAFDMESQRWTRLSNPYRGNISWPYSNGSFPDGSPSVAHTYDLLEYHPGTKSLVSLSAQSNDSAFRVNVAHMLDLGAKSWRHSKVNSSVTVAGGGYSVYDSKRDVFWLEGGSGSDALVQYNPNVNNGDGTYGKWTNYPTKLHRTDSIAAYDPANDLMVVTTFRDGTQVYGIDLSNPAAGPVQLNEGGTPPSKRSAHGWEWSNSRAAFIYYRDGDGVYEFKKGSGSWQTAVWSWKKLTSGSNSVTPPTVDNGVYSRFRIARYADAEIAVVANSTTGPVYAFRIPTGIEPKAPTNVTAE
jgi:hypothetical protein